MHRLQTWLAIAGSAVALAACGSDSGTAEPSGSSPASSSSSSNDQDAAQVRLRQCLNENGVEVPDTAQGGGPPADLDREKLQEALEGPCREFQTGAFGDLSEEDRQEFQDSFAKFAQCMRDEGVEVPDVAAGEAPPAGGGGFDADDPDVQAAMRKCQDELPQDAPGGGGQ